MLQSTPQLYQHGQPLTLIHCHCISNNLRFSSSSVLSLIISVLITVLTTICVSTQANVLDSNTPLPLKSCVTSKDCGDVHKVCVNGQCKCKPFFDYVPRHGTCLKSFGSNCTTFEHSNEELCNIDKYLSCDATGTCSCHIEGDSYLIYDTFLEKCVAPPGHQCELVAFSDVQKECVVNAHCVVDSNRKVDQAFFGICKCDKGYVGKGEKCVPEEGSSCELDVDCDLEGMWCLKGKCKCAEDRIYIKKGHDCKVQVGKGCEVAEKNCVDFAECVQVRNAVSYHWENKCECELGYQEIPENKTCQKDSHGNCAANMIYDEKRGRCSLKVDEACKQSDVNRCVIHAFCGTGDKCKCFEGYQVTGNGTCEKGRTVVVLVEPELVVEVKTTTRESSTMLMESPQHYKDDGQFRKTEATTSSAERFISSHFILVPVVIMLVKYTQFR